MNIILPFTRQLPEQAPNRNMPDWVACRFDGYPDFRSDLSIAGLRVIANWPGEWAWCEDSELQALLKQAAKPTEAGDQFLSSKIELLEAELQALRGGLIFVHGEVSRLVGEVQP